MALFYFYIGVDKMLDLSALYNAKFFEVKMLDGSVLNIIKPAIDFLVELEGFFQIQNSKSKKVDIKQIATLTEEMATKILNNNKEGISIEQNYVRRLGFDLQLLIIREYIKFTRELMANPN